MKRATVTLEVSVTVEVPDEVYARDKADGDLSENDIWYDYAVGAVSQHVEVLHGKPDSDDWVKLSSEVVSSEIEEGPEDL